VAAATVAAFIDDRWTRVAFVVPIAVALAVLATLAIDRCQRARRARQLAEGRIEEVRREGETTFRALAEKVQGVTWLTRNGDRRSLLYISPQVEALLGYTPAEWQAEPNLFSKLLHPDDRERVLTELEAAAADGYPFRSAYRLVARDGRIIGIREA